MQQSSSGPGGACTACAANMLVWTAARLWTHSVSTLYFKSEESASLNPEQIHEATDVYMPLD